MLLRKLAAIALPAKGNSPRHIFITGVPASGKTTEAHRLERKMGIPVLHGDELRAGGRRYPGTAELRRELRKLKSPHIVEGVQVMGLRPEEVAGHDVRLLEPPQRAIVGRLMRRGWKSSGGGDRYDREGALKLYNEMSQNLGAFKGRLHKEATVALSGPGEFAPGIPSERKILPVPRVGSTRPEAWGMALQEHAARRAGAHIDLRLVDKSGRAHSWVIPKGSLPKPGEKIGVLPQPTHTREYAERKGKFTIPAGYGAGEVRSGGLKPVEVVRSEPGRLLRFNVYGGKKEGNQEFALVTTPKGQLLHNISATAESGVRGIGGHEIPSSKPKYREREVSAVSFDDEREVHQAKVDGAHVTFHLRAGKPVKIFSHRPTERATGVLEHSHKLPRFRELTAPPGLAGTVLRGELYGEKGGRAIPAEQTGGLLNASVWKSRERQKQLGAKLKPVIFDVVRYQGRDVEGQPYEQKLKILEEVQRKVPRLKMPPTARTSREKEVLLARIQAGKEPITREGIVSWNLDSPRPTKAKLRPDVDAEVVGVTPGRGKHEGRIGALQVRLPGRSAVTNVGTGLSDRLREQISRDPKAYVGRVAKVRTQQVFKSGKLRAPSFGGFHIEKGKQ